MNPQVWCTWGSQANANPDTYGCLYRIDQFWAGDDAGEPHSYRHFGYSFHGQLVGSIDRYSGTPPLEATPLDLFYFAACVATRLRRPTTQRRPVDFVGGQGTSGKQKECHRHSQRRPVKRRPSVHRRNPNARGRDHGRMASRPSFPLLPPLACSGCNTGSISPPAGRKRSGGTRFTRVMMITEARRASSTSGSYRISKEP